MKKWDHFVTDLGGDITQEQQELNSISKDGWELVSIVVMHLCRRAYFKRQFTEEIPDPPPEYNEEEDMRWVSEDPPSAEQEP